MSRRRWGAVMTIEPIVGRGDGNSLDTGPAPPRAQTLARRNFAAQTWRQRDACPDRDTGLVSAAWPLPAVFAATAMLGLTGLSWNGIYLAEVAAIAPPGAATGGARSMTFLGIVLGAASKLRAGICNRCSGRV